MFNYDNGSAAAAVRPPLLKDVINLLVFLFLIHFWALRF